MKSNKSASMYLKSAIRSRNRVYVSPTAAREIGAFPFCPVSIKIDKSGHRVIVKKGPHLDFDGIVNVSKEGSIRFSSSYLIKAGITNCESVKMKTMSNLNQIRVFAN